MAVRRPLCIVGNSVEELPTGDTLPGSGGGVAWSSVSANTAMVADSAYIVTGAHDMTLPAGVAVGEQFIVHAATATVRIVSNGNVIAGVGSGNDLTIAEGETAYLVGSSTGNLEIV